MQMELKPDSVEEIINGSNQSTSEPDDVKTQESSKEPEAANDPQPQPEKRKRGRPPKKKLEDMTASEQITLHAQRNTYSVEMADKETKKELYAREDVFVEDGDELQPDNNDAAVRKEEYLELVASANNNRIVKGTIESVTEVPTNKDEDAPDYIPEYMARVKFKTGKFEVSIPSFVLYDYDYPNMNQFTAHEIQQNIMRRIGSEITFVVRHVNEEKGTAIGDRLAALSMRAIRNYTMQNGNTPRVVPGMKVQSKITAIARDFISVDAAGAECRIPLEEISWLYNTDARNFDGIATEECYKVGDYVTVKILSVKPPKRVKKYNSVYSLVDITASIKQAMPNPREKYFEQFKIGDIYRGYITGITERGIYVNLANKMDCLCQFPKGNKRMPVMGESVVVQIFATDEEKKYIYGNLK